MAYEWLQKDKEIRELPQDEFISLLKEKTKQLVRHHGPLIDIIHQNDAYYDVGEIIDMLISYFWGKL